MIKYVMQHSQSKNAVNLSEYSRFNIERNSIQFFGDDRACYDVEWLFDTIAEAEHRFQILLNEANCTKHDILSKDIQKYQAVNKTK